MEQKQIIDAVHIASGRNPEAGINAKPSQFQIFKGKSAMRIQLDIPNRKDQEFKVGCLFLQAAPVKAGGRDDGYDWENKKISVKIGVNDISAMLYGLRNRRNVELFHEFGGDTKAVKFQVKDDGTGYFMNLDHSAKDGSKNKVMVPLTPEETDALIVMLQYALPKIHNW